MSNRMFLLLLSTVIVGGALIGGGSAAVHRLEPRPASVLAEIVPQPVTTRRWRPMPTERSLVIDETRNGLRGPLHLEVDRRGHLFVVDFADMAIKEFSSAGELLRVIADPSAGPLQSITDIHVGDDEIWIADNSGGRLLAVDSGNEVQRVVDVEPWPYRLVASDSALVVMHALGSPHLFTRIARSGTVLGTFGPFVEDQEEAGLALDGWLAPDGEGGFVYAGLYVGLLARFTMDGERRFAVSTIDPTPLPTLVQQENGAVWVHRDAPATTLSLSVAGTEVHVLAVVEEGLRRRGVIDTYDLGSGRYLYSTRVPERCSRAVVTPSSVYTVADNSISRWRRL